MNKHLGPLIRRYSSALMESVSDSSMLYEVGESARLFLTFINKEFLSFFRNHFLSEDEKIVFLKEVASRIAMPDILLQTLIVMVRNRRFDVCKYVLEDFISKADQKLGILHGSMVTSHHITKLAMTEFEQALSEIFKKKVYLKNEKDENLLAGYVLRLGNLQVDASLRSRLNRLKETL